MKKKGGGEGDRVTGRAEGARGEKTGGRRGRNEEGCESGDGQAAEEVEGSSDGW